MFNDTKINYEIKTDNDLEFTYFNQHYIKTWIYDQKFNISEN